MCRCIWRAWPSGRSAGRASAPQTRRSPNWDAAFWSRCHASAAAFLDSHLARIAAECDWSTLELFTVDRETGAPRGIALLFDLPITQVTGALVRSIDGNAHLRQPIDEPNCVAVWGFDAR
jgi:hypothetical protein